MFSLQAQKVSDDLLQRVGSQNRRALDLVAAKCYYYHSRVYEFLNQLDTIRRYALTHTYCRHKRLILKRSFHLGVRVPCHYTK